jgi:thimet oligopeptidase
LPKGSQVVSALLACSLVPLLGAAPQAAHGLASALQAPGENYALDPAQIAANCSAQIAAAKATVAAIVAVPAAQRTFATIVLPLENAASDLNDNLMVETLLSNTSTSRPVRDASYACQNDVSDFLTAATARPDLYAALAAAQAGGSASDAAQRKLTDVWLVALKRSGAALSAADRTTFVTLSQRLSKLENDYAANLGNDKTTVTLTQAQVAGIPADVVAGFTKTAAGYVVKVDESVITPILANATDPAARKATYFAYGNRAMPQNAALLEEAIGIRAKLAHLLAYPTWAAYVLDDRMAKSVARVDTFLDGLDAKLLPAARGDVARLATLKAADPHAVAGPIEAWDFGYYDNMLRKTTYAVDDDAVRQYFPVQHVERAVFDIYSKLLGVTFAERTNANVWAPDVTEWTVTDSASGKYIGDFYLDLFPRDGKYSHFASFPLLPNRKLADGNVRPPLDAIIGNWPKPAPGAPALLTHEDVETFFHEFGHDMATLLATTPYETLSSGFRQDFVEAPSQMLENWVWDPAILKALSSNVTTGRPLPDELIAKLRAARYVDDAYVQTRQIMLATIDMRYHTLPPPVDTNAVWHQVAQAETPLPLAPGLHPEASFGHLMGGYDAGYYGYLWSKVYAQDMFTAFQRGGLESPLVGARYREDILAPAREREPDAEVDAFLGRPMDPTAFYAEFDSATKQGR